MNSLTFAAHQFGSIESLTFSAQEYSWLKFGSDAIARKFGYELADKFFAEHAPLLLSNDCVVIPSPYNFVPNAATIMAKHFVDRINQKLVAANGNHVDWSIIHRKVSYVNDYGFLDADKRKALIDGDSFYINHGFLKNKLLICIDDVRITGTHEHKLAEVLSTYGLKNKTAFLYFANYDYTGSGAEIEAHLNFAGIKTFKDYIELMDEKNHHIIVRPMKYMLSQDKATFLGLMKRIYSTRLLEVYHACLGEGFYKIPAYQENFNAMRQVLNG